MTGWPAAQDRAGRSGAHVPDRAALQGLHRSRERRSGGGGLGRRARQGSVRPRDARNAPAWHSAPGRSARARACRREKNGWSRSRVRLRRKPKFLLLDEPGAGLNDAEIETFLAHLATRCGRQSAAAIVIVDHDMRLDHESLRPHSRAELRENDWRWDARTDPKRTGGDRGLSGR